MEGVSGSGFPVGRLSLTLSCSVCDKIHILRGGAVAQLGARLDGIEEVVGSNPISSTKISIDNSRGSASL